MKIDFQNQQITIYFAENIQYLLKKCHMTYRDLLNAIGYDNKKVYLVGKWVNEIELPSLEDIIKIAIVFQISLEELITVNLEKCDTLKNK